MPTLFPHLPFHPEETPLSFATRLAARHTGGRLVPFINDLGVKAPELAGGEIGAITCLCAVAGVDAAPVLANTAQRISRRRFDLRGEIVSAEFLSGPETVFCPACLTEDGELAGRTAVNRKGRFIWTLRVVRTCPIHGLPLLRRARERWDDQFHELDLRVPERDSALDALVAALEPRPVSPLQDYVVGRLKGESGPDWLDGQTLEQAVRATEMLGVLVEFGAGAKLSTLGDEGWDRAGRAGFAATAAGEEGIRDALCQAQAAFLGDRQAGAPDRIRSHLYLARLVEDAAGSGRHQAHRSRAHLCDDGRGGG